MLNYNHLHYFHVAASEGSVAAAATRLGITQPTVSEQIRALEKTLGVTLFERTTTGLRLTRSGRVAHQHTSVIFGTGDRMIKALRDDPMDARRTLRVGVSTGVARSASADLLLPLFSLDGYLLSVRTSDTAELMRWLRSTELDVVLTETRPADSDMRGLELAELARSMLVAVALPDRSGFLSDASWEDVKIVRYRTESGSHWAIDNFLDEHDLTAHVVGEADDALLLVEAAARSGVVAFVPLSAAREAIAAGRLAVLTTVDSSDTPVHAVYSDGESSNIARRALALLAEHLANGV
jgi:DNA-binding transcriptional LysR family regulator